MTPGGVNFTPQNDFFNKFLNNQPINLKFWPSVTNSFSRILAQFHYNITWSSGYFGHVLIPRSSFKKIKLQTLLILYSELLWVSLQEYVTWPKLSNDVKVTPSKRHDVTKVRHFDGFFQFWPIWRFIDTLMLENDWFHLFWPEWCFPHENSALEAQTNLQISFWMQRKLCEFSHF